MRKLSSFLLLFFCAANSFGGPHWPGFRGPTGDGISEAGQAPLHWSETKNIVWKTAVSGHGWSSPVVWGKQVWLTTATRDGKKLFALCLDLATGRVVHNIKVFDVANPKPKIVAGSSYASPTPVIEAGRIYVHFGTYGTACLDTAKGTKLWERRDLKLDHKEGAGGSPILFGKRLIFSCDGQDVQYLVALDKETGKTSWKTERSADFSKTVPFQRKAYVTPLIVPTADEKQLISPGARAAYSYDPETGRELWKITYQGWSNVSGPVYGHGRVFINGGLGVKRLFAVRPSGKSDVTRSRVDWQTARGVPGLSSPVLVGDWLFMCTDKGVASCLEARTGKEVWKKRMGSNFSASAVFAAGRIYFCGEDGRTTVIRPQAKFEVLAVNKLDNMIRASPAIAGKSLIVRTESHVYRIEE